MNYLKNVGDVVTIDNTKYVVISVIAKTSKGGEKISYYVLKSMNTKDPIRGLYGTTGGEFGD